LSGLLKKRIQVDRTLGTVIGVPEGTVVSYAEIQKGLHKYIHDHGLRTDVPKPAVSPAVSPGVQNPEHEAPESQPRGHYCVSCGEAIPSGAVYCDLCGVLQ
jgi:hypothetical protein